MPCIYNFILATLHLILYTCYLILYTCYLILYTWPFFFARRRKKRERPGWSRLSPACRASLVKGAATYSPAFAVPSAWRGLTSLFGMGRGGAPALWPPVSFAVVLRAVLTLRRGGTGMAQEGAWKLNSDSRVSSAVIHSASAPRPCRLFTHPPRDAVLYCCGPKKGPQERVRAISIARLWTLPPLHLQPIYVVVCDDPVWRSYLGEGFVLRCFQHLS